MEEIKYSEILKENRRTDNLFAQHKPFRIKVLSNITCNQLKEIGIYYLRNNGINAQIEIGNYDNIVQDSYWLENNELVIIHYDLYTLLDKSVNYLENIPDEEITNLVASVKQELDILFDNVSKVPAVIFNLFSSGVWAASYPSFSKADKIVARLNEYVLSVKQEHVFAISLDKLFQGVGIPESVDFKMYYLSSTLYNIAFWKKYVSTISAILLKLTGKVKKAIVFDCDNTLWKGILGEDGEEGIDMNPQSKIGQIFYKVQQIAVWLSNAGIIVCLCSKNNEADVEHILTSHPDMLLKNDHIILKKINWQDKVTNLRELAADLNIGTDSMVFVDDSSFEVNLVKEQLPAVKTFQVPVALHEYPYRLVKFIHQYFYFSGTKDDLAKTRQYKEQLNRNIEKQKYTNLEDYLSLLKTEITVHINDDSQVARISQLTQKTNQFNLTTQRYSESQIKAFMEDGSSFVYSFNVSDKFGDNGLTAVCIIWKEKEDTCRIDTFLMSCRIMGRNIEKKLIDYILLDLRRNNIKIVEADYLATLKNKPVEDFFDSLGFTLTSTESTNKHYQLFLADYRYNNINYIKIAEDGPNRCENPANHG